MSQDALRIGMDYIPNDHQEDPAIHIVVDVIRATSTIVTLFELGCERVFLTDDVAKVHTFNEGRTQNRLLICAEDAVGRRLAGVDFSPSLAELHAQGSFEGREVVIQTSNGTAAMHKLVTKGAVDIFSGSMLNLKAVTEAAFNLAYVKGQHLNIVCAGRNNGIWATLDDVYCGAKMIEYALIYAQEKGIPVKLFDSAAIAYSQLKMYPDTETALMVSASAKNLKRIGTEADITLCAKTNLSTLAPKLAYESEYPFIEIRSR